MSDRTEAMGNLIAQDADLIDTNDKDSAVLLIFMEDGFQTIIKSIFPILHMLKPKQVQSC